MGCGFMFLKGKGRGKTVMDPRVSFQSGKKVFQNVRKLEDKGKCLRFSAH